MHLLIPPLLLCGLLCRLVTADPSPQWLYQQIHALPVGKSDHVTAELHIKKSDIPEHKKRKDGVKRLFNFLDSAIQESGSGSGEGSTQETVTMTTRDHSGLTGLTEKEVNRDENKKQEEISNSPDLTQQKAKVAENLTNEHLAAANMAKTSFTGYGQRVSTALPGLNPQVANQFTVPSQQGVQRVYYAPQRTTGFAAYSGQHTSTYSPNVSPYTRLMQAQKTLHGYPVAGQQPQSYGYAASRRRPPAIPVRSQVTANVLRTQQPLATAQRFVGGPHGSNIQGPFSFTTTIMGPNKYGGYNLVDTHGIPVADGKSPASLQERPYGQLKRQRYQFHQQTRALIPERVPIRTYARYPYPVPPANFPGQVRGIIESRLPYQRAKPLVSRAQIPLLQRPVGAPPSSARFPGQVYYRNGIPQRQASLAYAAHMMRSHGYPLITRPRIGRAVINRKPQPRNVVTSLTAAAARLVVPARPEANDKSATAEIVWSSSAPQPGAHAVRSNTHPEKV